ncbi:MAG: ShlB/FhaC/HecB family hemolysin secretion/activation protein, partial [Zoogloea sp.]|nr:ShlB/FhaC/HecB family hemolysin secretion/activation protein [Zoogloea sp.]
MALAQQDAGQILRQLEGTPAPPLLQDAPVIDQRPALRREISDVPDLVVDISAFRLVGVPEAEQPAILGKLAGRRGAGRSFQDILDAAGVVRAHLNGRGYLLAQAYVPEQRLHDGVVEIAVLMGELGRVELNFDPATPVSRQRVEAYLARLRPGAVLHTGDLERVLFLLNDMHGVHAVSTIRPGSRPGTADLLVEVKPDRALSGNLQLD